MRDEEGEKQEIHVTSFLTTASQLRALVILRRSCA
jgi:hypothetical protein